jgi:Ca2+-transporting ATPase
MGLSHDQAAQILREEGPNELPSAKPRNTLVIALEVMREPMFLLLVGTGIVYLILGDLQEAIALMGAIFVVIGITLYQERKTEHALQKLRELASPRALVIREGAQKRIAGRDVVSGDLVVLSEGDRVPADGVVVSGVNFSADESLLTGESVPVRKVASSQETTVGRPGGDDLPFVYSGTLIVQGHGIARIAATGIHTELGKIGKALQSLEPEKTRIQKETGRLVMIFATLGLSLSVLVAIVYALTRGSWLNGILAGLTMAISVVPEELPVVLTIFLALGAWRISQKRVLTRRIPAVETLGSTTVLCVDKTGTLTLNRMTVTQLCANGETIHVSAGNNALPECFQKLVEYSALASQENPFDPMERALKELASVYKLNGMGAGGLTLLREYPLSRNLLAMTRAWEAPGLDDRIIAAKGAPEAIAELCRFTASQLRELTVMIHSMASRGLRVLGVASARFPGSGLPDLQQGFQFEFLGLVGLADPIRPAVPAAIQECYTAGIRVVMITGDYPVTAQNIAHQCGLRRPDDCITGPELDILGDEELRSRLQSVDVFARVVPEQKLRLVRAFKANGEVVAMTGDGVNDAPALKSANIGVAMGGRGTDVARESASLVLLDDDFSSIVEAVRLGRRIYDNLKKAIAYVFAIHVPIAGMSLLPVLFKWPLFLLPLHIVFLELIIDPACSTAFEAEREDENTMKRPPRDPQEPLFNRRTLTLSFLQGLGVLLTVLVVFGMALRAGRGELEARALAFTTMIVANVGLIWTNRSWTRTILRTLRMPNKPVWAVTLGAMGFLALILYTPFLRNLFRLSSLHALDIAICLAAGLGSILWFEFYKIIRRG